MFYWKSFYYLIWLNWGLLLDLFWIFDMEEFSMIFL